MTDLFNCKDCGHEVSIEAQGCPWCGFPVARWLLSLGRLMKLRDRSGLAIPANSELLAMSLSVVEEWLAWARLQIRTCPFCISTNIVPIRQPGFFDYFMAGAVIGAVGGLTGGPIIGVFVLADGTEATHGCQECGQMWRDERSYPALPAKRTTRAPLPAPARRTQYQSLRDWMSEEERRG